MSKAHEQCISQIRALMRLLPAAADPHKHCVLAAQTTFRRVLLNKCQEEFEEGDAAMKAVDAREKAAAAAEAQNVRPSVQQHLWTKFAHMRLASMSSCCSISLVCSAHGEDT